MSDAIAVNRRITKFFGLIALAFVLIIGFIFYKIGNDLFRGILKEKYSRELSNVELLVKQDAFEFKSYQALTNRLQNGVIQDIPIYSVTKIPSVYKDSSSSYIKNNYPTESFDNDEIRAAVLSERELGQSFVFVEVSDQTIIFDDVKSYIRRNSGDHLVLIYTTMDEQVRYLLVSFVEAKNANQSTYNDEAPTAGGWELTAFRLLDPNNTDEFLTSPEKNIQGMLFRTTDGYAIQIRIKSNADSVSDQLNPNAAIGVKYVDRDKVNGKAKEFSTYLDRFDPTTARLKSSTMIQDVWANQVDGFDYLAIYKDGEMNHPLKKLLKPKNDFLELFIYVLKFVYPAQGAMESKHSKRPMIETNRFEDNDFYFVEFKPSWEDKYNLRVLSGISKYDVLLLLYENIKPYLYAFSFIFFATAITFYLFYRMIIRRIIELASGIQSYASNEAMNPATLDVSEVRDEIDFVSKKFHETFSSLNIAKSELASNSAELKKQIDSKSEISSILEHQIRNTLFRIKIIHESDAKTNRLVDKIILAISHITKSSSFSDAITHSGTLAQVNIREYVAAYIRNTKDDFLKDFRVCFTVGDVEGEHAMANEDGIEIVLEAILANAKTFARHNISLEFRSTPENVYLMITNDGPNIDDPDIENIFNYGFSKRSNHDSDENRGIGLWIARQNMRKMKGDIVCHNSAGGVTFWLIFPCDTQAVDEVSIASGVRDDIGNILAST